MRQTQLKSKHHLVVGSDCRIGGLMVGRLVGVTSERSDGRVVRRPGGLTAGRSVGWAVLLLRLGGRAVEFFSPIQVPGLLIQ